MKFTRNKIFMLTPLSLGEGSGVRLRKSFLITLIAIITLSITPIQHATPAIPVLEVIRQGIKKAIRAIDLMIQRLQNRTIALQNAQKVIENKLSQLKLKEIAEWTNRQRELYKDYYDELWKVRNTIDTYKRIRLILLRQQQIIDQYKFTWAMINQDKHFTPDEINYMYRVYSGILKESMDNLDQILLVINAYKLQMTDAKRLDIINQAGDRIEQNYNDLMEFNNQNIQLSLNRSKDQHEIENIKKLYGLQD